MQQLDKFLESGFTILEGVYTVGQIDKIIQQINQANSNKATFRKSTDLFAIRQFLKEVPSVLPIIINDNLKTILKKILGEKHIVVKSIYFDKPSSSNWYVSYHQDLTISVDKKLEVEGFSLWTTKEGQFSVQPPLDILQNIITVRIHLDDTDGNNGALKVLPGSHLKGICRPQTINRKVEDEEVTCSVPRGGIMLMKPLLLHSSGRTTNSKQRRVIHIEFSNLDLPEELNWAERVDLN